MPGISVGPLELIIVLAIALIILGPGRLPEVGSAVGKTIREFRKAASEVQEETSLEPRPAPRQPQPADPYEASSSDRSGGAS
jgi:sec-independent protein translocase protein TatA